MSTSQRRRSGGFSLIELLIVVVILAIIAAIVVPQLSATTDDAKVSALASNLSRMRAAIDLYYQQHGAYPGASTAVTPGTCPSSGTKGTGDASNAAAQAQAFADQLTMYTNATGHACSTTDSTFRFGPYIKSAELGLNGIPKNPITDNRTVVVVDTGNLIMTGSATAAGWRYDIQTGKFIADDANYDDL
ncbi:MAG: prepilin-type N-terminal cleavage/methylation domain-containing protein [Gammaproteobacteria bacterium]|nr:prepilin-type N-terminal cleavage/methylation domain-containing protein [Gammaproteobacteria bacterium]